MTATRSIRRRIGAALLLLAFAGLPAAAQTRPEAPLPEASKPAPEDASGWHDKPLVSATRQMVVAAHPDAVAAGLAMLRAGGSATDAAIATQLVLNVVEPQSSGIGGGAFLLHHDGASGTLETWDGRETAPAAATPELFLTASGTPMTFSDAVVGGRAVGVPGVLAVLAKVHAQHGKLPWRDLFAPAIALARDGFTVGPRLAEALDGPRGAALRAEPTTRDYFFPGGTALAAGDIVRNPALAATFEAIAGDGPDVFYRGDLAQAIAAAVQGHATNPGGLTAADLAAYTARKRAPVCILYRVWRVCGMGPPSSGGIAVAQILGQLEPFSLPTMGPRDPVAWHLIAEAGKLAFADRDRYVADNDYITVPTAGLLDRRYLVARAAQIDASQALTGPAEAGTPPWREGRLYAPDATEGRPGTSHISIVDATGNAVSITTTIEGAFGAHLMVGGFLLNNQLTDFSFRPEIDGVPVANAVAPGKRPRSSMAPTMVYGLGGGGARDTLLVVAGSPGGSHIIGYVAQTLVALLDWRLDAQAAVSLPHLVNRNGPTDIEDASGDTDLADAVAAALSGRGHEIRRRAMNSGLHVIEIRNGVLYGGADPRREGIAAGD